MQESVIIGKNIKLVLGSIASRSDLDKCDVQGCNVEINEHWFPTKVVSGVFKVLTLNDSLTIKEVVEFTKKQGFKPGHFHDLLALSHCFPDAGQKPVLALGTIIKDAVPGLWHGCGPNQKTIHLFKFDGNTYSPGTQVLVEI